MKRTMLILLLATWFLAGCNDSPEKTANETTDSSSIATGPENWKFGIALWTFHTFNFPQALDKVDSAGLSYIEPNTFHKAGPEFKDSMILQLSPDGIDKLKSLITKKGLKVESLYSWRLYYPIMEKAI